MSELEAVLLGLVQGLTEFLPVSSSGHLVIAQSVLGVAQEGLVFEIALHVATLLSVLIVYRRRVAELIVGVLTAERDALEYGAKLVLASVPAVVVVLLFGDLLEATFDEPAVAGVCLLVTGGLLWSTRYTATHAQAAPPSWKAAFWMGCAQAFAILPGISRSGSTVAVGMACRVEAVTAAEFSFMMSVVAISGAAARQLFGLGSAPLESIAPLALGAAVAAVSGVIAIWIFVRLLRTRAFHRFAYYTWAAGAAYLIWLGL